MKTELFKPVRALILPILFFQLPAYGDGPSAKWKSEMEPHVRSWIGAKKQDYVDKVLNNIWKEKRRLIESPKEVQYGQSFSGINSLSEECLKEIQKRFKKDKKRVRVLDIGAGHGYMTKKMVLAGGTV